MLLALDHTEPDDFVIATGVSHQIKDVVTYVFSKLGLDWEQYVTHDARLLRAQELPHLRGDASKARRVLGWKPTYTFETLLDEMIEHELALQGGRAK
jgi:GDPmannose 4,6-dehydratase